MDFDSNRKFNLIIGVSVYLPEFFQRWPLIFRILYQIFEIAQCLVMLLQVIGCLAMIIMHYDDINVLCSSGGSFVFISQVIVKLITIKTHEELFNKSAKSISETSEMLCKNPMGDSNFPALYEKYYRLIRIILPVKAGFEFVGFMSMMCFYVIRSWFYENAEERVMPAPMWTPFNVRERDNYVGLIFFESVSGMGALLKNTALDVFFCTLLIVTSTQLKYLKELQKKIVEDYEARVNKILATKGNEEEKSDCIKVLENNLRWWVQRHQKILKTIVDMKPITSPYVLTIYFMMMMVMFLVGVVSISSSSWNLVQKTMILGIVWANVFQLYIISTIGDVLENDAFKVTDDGFNESLLSSSNFIRKCYLFMVARGKKPLKIKAVEMIPLSAHTFGEFARITFSYFVTIVQLRQEKQERESIDILI